MVFQIFDYPEFYVYFYVVLPDKLLWTFKINTNPENFSKKSTEFLEKKITTIKSLLIFFF